MYPIRRFYKQLFIFSMIIIGYRVEWELRHFKVIEFEKLSTFKFSPSARKFDKGIRRREEH